MCGISGVIAARPERLERVVAEQLARQRHRGPDAAGHFAGDRGVVAQNRLAIIDLVTGDPPVTNEDGSIGAVLNGEIYNFGRLREDLERDGHELRTSGDTEVLAHLAERLDPVALARALDGMFAFAVWDRRRERLVIGRDRLGKKPLHYWHGDGMLVFASEIKGVLAHPLVPRELDGGAIPAYLSFGYVPTPRTFFAGIKSLPPGHVLTFAPGGEPAIERYWTPPLPAAGDHLDISLDEAACEVRRRLERAIRRRLVSDVPLGAFLSGGVDSSAIVALMAGSLGEKVQTFTIGFEDDDGFDERPYARAVAERFGTDHREFVVEPDAIDLVERLVWHHDQPFGDSSAVPTYRLNEVTRNHVTVALAGDGGDELFAGYERFAAGLMSDRYRSLPITLRRAGRAAIGLLPPTALRGRAGNVQRFAAVAEGGMPDAYLAWVSFIDPELRARLLPAGDDWAHDEFRELWESTRGAAGLDRLLDLNLRTYLLDDLLVKMDRMSMAHGLEVRSPFLDTDLLEFVTRLRPSLKLRGLSLKRVLKHALRDLLPAEILGRRKRGFGVPLDRWFRHDLRSYAEGMLGAGARIRGHLAADAIDSLLADHTAGRRRSGHALWTLLTLEVFLRREGW